MQPTKNQKAIYKLLTTSTWSALCDSGGAYGRHWQRNQARSIQDFIRDPQVYIELTHYIYDGEKPTEHLVQSGFHITKYHYDPRWVLDSTSLSTTRTSEERVNNVEYSYTISLFHWLDRYFDIANTENDPFVSKFNRLRKGQHDYLEDRQDEYLESIGYQKGDTMNSYNWYSNMSQVYQLTPVYPIGTELAFWDQEYYLLSIHQGCDVRWGYTTDIMVKIDPNEYPNETVYWHVEYTDDKPSHSWLDESLAEWWNHSDSALWYPVSNSYDGCRIRHDEHPTLQDQEIDPDKIVTLSLFLS